MSFVKLGEEIILILLWQSGASESVTVCFVISLILAIDCLNTEFCALCVCERESHSAASFVCVCVCDRVCERGGDKATQPLLVCTYEIHHGVCHATLFLFRAWTDGTTKNIINCLYFSFESWSL